MQSAWPRTPFLSAAPTASRACGARRTYPPWRPRRHRHSLGLYHGHPALSRPPWQRSGSCRARFQWRRGASLGTALHVQAAQTRPSRCQTAVGLCRPARMRRRCATRHRLTQRKVLRGVLSAT